VWGPALLDTLKDLVSIESGSRDLEGLDKIANAIAARLKQLGGKVELIEADPRELAQITTAPEKVGKMVRATFQGTGKRKILPEAEVTLDFRRSRPPLQATDGARALAAHAQKIYAEIGRKLNVPDRPTGGGTDAAYAALKTKSPVLEGFGLSGYGSHSTDAEYIAIETIEPRLYLATRMIMDISQGKAALPAR
jgi:acetylornithine deacetylase/succinyl-diaminopimelate desuccinylase-like protein